ncbi:urea carboxylase [Dichomitus squalens LYAD-421 SS1]|uniref:Urea carboxylase n=1 Tax=Dichomitus squalens (strain LYAD-421) TaxID=732165 RepID=R7SJP5_DICSQ|nr:urea carboxylase [Dichomitus squalens LYAD-421 SS1]EJF56376.1 urea carboxylase [Dichomitus squalens LYAD-421 SS1]
MNLDSGASTHTLLVANRGEIAVRILRTAKRLGIRTLAVYTRSDATSPHVTLADEAAPLREQDEDPVSNARGYIDAEAIIAVCKERGVTLLHPGYGFLSENSDFARKVADAGVIWLGPRAETIEAMGLKHRARELAREVDVPLVPGSNGLLQDMNEAVASAEEIGFPVMLKSTAGGGGMGLVVCATVDELRARFAGTQARAETLFHNNGLFIERYYLAARHVEVQVFGDGAGHAIHMGERECSVQRRHQKVIEEAPSPFMLRHPDIREKMCIAAVRLSEHVTYESAGTVEFLVDDVSGEFFFLEMNTRLQVEHPVTEQVNPGLDIVELMILQGIARHDGKSSEILSHPFLNQALYEAPPHCHAIEVRLYCENPAAQFKPCPGVLQQVKLPEVDWLRVESWVESGTTITPYYDPLACKLVVTGSTRVEAIQRLTSVLKETEVLGPPNNVQYLLAICGSQTFQFGNATTTFLHTFSFVPKAFTVLSGGLETTVQDYPGRRIGLGIPRSGPMDSLAFRIANILVGNDPGTEGLEATLTGCRLLFHVAAVVAVTGASAKVTVDGNEIRTWKRVAVPAGAKLAIGPIQGTGMRAYLAMRGGFPEIPKYLGSKSTSMGLGGYQGRGLTAGDQVVLGDCAPGAAEESALALPEHLIPIYPSDWTIHVLSGPQSDPTFITEQGIAKFFTTKWTVSAASNRMGVRLEGPRIAWARENGGEGGSHPSNILDNGYAFGTVNVNGDTPVILTNEGPDMGGYVCVCTIASAELWKLGQLRAGSTVRFKRISYQQAIGLYQAEERFFREMQEATSSSRSFPPFLPTLNATDHDIDPRLHDTHPDPSSGRPGVVFRQAGDSAILVECGEMTLDFAVRARIHAFETEIRRCAIPGIWFLAPCIRSTMVHFDPLISTQAAVLASLINAEHSLPASVESLTFPGRRITFPTVLDDRWNREALEKYMRSTRATAAYLPSNIEYLARNNGFENAEEALKKLVGTDWLVLGVGFYLACPFLVPIDPRSRLVGQKMNPSRTYTPRGAIGIAGLVAAIYPIQSPGGYQLFGRTLPPWQTWGKGRDFSPDSPWLLRPFDQVVFEAVSEEQYLQAENRFDAGQYAFRIEDRTFSMAEYTAFVRGISDEVRHFKERQARGVAAEEAREKVLFAEWDQQRREELEARRSAVPEPIDPGGDGGPCVTSSLTAQVWKIKCSIGDVVKSAGDVLIILEAMKTEVNVQAEEENVGRKVVGFGRGVREGGTVQAGDPLVYFE